MLRKLILCTLLFSNIIYAQIFISSNENVFTGLNVSDADVGDYDSDGDLDIIMTGLNSGTPNTLLYNNDGSGNFSLSSITFNDNYRNGQVEFIDYDNDNDLDIFITGLVQSGDFKSRLYQNNANVFTEIPFAFGGDIINNQFAWGDLDLDGDLDLLLMGNFEIMNDFAYLYRNDGGNNFTEISQSFLPLSQGKILMADIDNDGDNDIVTGGLSLPSFDSSLEIYENNGNYNFVSQVSFEGFVNGDIELRDCDNNGYIDIVKNGDADGGNSSKMYLNTGNFTFNENTSVGFTSVGGQANIVSADYNGNGELDFLIAGRLLPYTGLSFSTSIFENSGNLSLTENFTPGIPDDSYNAIEIGDFDNDNDVDVFVLKNDVSYTFTNQTIIQNTLPSAPSNLFADVIESDVVLNWNTSTDNESPEKQLTYNLYLGTASGTTNIISPMSDINTGHRKVVGIGNSQYKNQAVLMGLSNGTYYWAVQSIDNQYEGSAFSTEQTFTISNLSTEDLERGLSIQYYPNPVSNQLTILSNQHIEKMTISTILGENLKTIVINKLSNFEIDFTSYDLGIYFVSVHSSEGEEVIKVIKR